VSVEEAKREAARSALAELPESGIVGLGSGSTSRLFIDEVGALVKNGRQLRGVATSEGSRQQAESLGIPLLGDEGPWDIAVTVDGADEVDARLNLIKGGGAAHTREKIVNYASRRNVIIVDDSKLSQLLGEKWPIPLEVLRFAHLTTVRALERLGRVVARAREGKAIMTDAGNFVYDLHTGTMADPAAMDRELRSIPGVVETGLFVGRADVVIVAGSSGVRRLERPV
jgi:ribose 5-phosphate isomerase A